MFSAASRVSLTPGLDRLEMLRQQGRWLFQGDRTPNPLPMVYPRAIRATIDPLQQRGWWLPGAGQLFPCPVITDVFASPLAAAMLAVTQSLEGPGVFHVDEFPDGGIAFTVGKNNSSRGMFERTVRAASRLDALELLPNSFVNVFPKTAFLEERQGLPLAGLYLAIQPIQPEVRVPLSAGDARLLAKLLGRKLPRLDAAEVAWSAPFTGVFGAGGQLQFEPISGARIWPHRLPSDGDRVRSLELSKQRAGRWREQRQSIELEVIHSLPPSSQQQRSISPTFSEGTSDFGRALTFIERNCTRSLAVSEIAAVAQLSPGRLHAVFKETMGCTPLQYVSERRLEVAERLLKETALSVAEVSERCGFAEQTSLTRLLRLRRGVTPSELRRAATDSDRKSR